MPSASAKLEKQGSLEALEPMKQILTVVEKKVRNLEKRKGKLDAYKNDSQNGKELNDDQKKAVEKYDQVVEVLEFAKEMQKQFTSIIQETSKAQKKVAKREQLERQQHELHRFKEIIMIQEILNSMGGDDVREDFLKGTNGAITLTENELNGLDELYKLICPERDSESQDSSEFDQQLTAAAEHFQALLDSKNKEVIGTTYKALKEVIMKIHACTYFNKTAISNSEPEAGDISDVNDAKEFQETSDVDESHSFHSGAESKTEEPSVPPGLTANQGERLYFQQTENPSSFQDQTRPIQDVLPVQGNLNFLQESQINLESASLMDHTSVATPHPAVSNTVCYGGNYVSSAQTSVSQDISTQQSQFQQRSKEEVSLSGHLSSSGQGIPHSIAAATSVQAQQSRSGLNFTGSTLQNQNSTTTLTDFDPNRPIPTQTYTNQSFTTAIHPMMAGVAVPQNYSPVTLTAHVIAPHHVVGTQSVQQQQPPQPQRGPPGVPPPTPLDPSSLTSQTMLPVSTAVSKLNMSSQDAKDCFVSREYSIPQVSRERDASHLTQPTTGAPTSQYERLNTHQGYQSTHNSQSYISRDNFPAESSTYSSNLKRGLQSRGIPRTGNSRGGSASAPRSNTRGAYRA